MLRRLLFELVSLIAPATDGAPGNALLSRRRTHHLPGGSPCTSFFTYHDAKHIIIPLKYGSPRLLRICAPILQQELERIVGEGGEESRLIMPIPLSPLRRFFRGHNQNTLLIERALALLDRSARAKLTFEKGNLVKIRETKKQSFLSRAERLKSQEGAFAVRRPETLAGKSVILIDDVATTGATLAETRHTLLKSGAKEIICIALAH